MFITFEGGEGSGKSTMAKKLSRWLAREHNISNILTREPRGIYRKMILEKSSNVPSKAELMLFLADRAAHWENLIQPALQDNIWVICDRFTDSTVAYQGYANGFNVDLIKRLNKELTQLKEPDLTFYLQLEPEVGLARASDPNKYRKKGIDYHQRVKYGFDQVALQNKNRIKVIDASLSSERVFNKIKEIISTYLQDQK